MNDFTKEELEKLSLTVSNYRNDYDDLYYPELYEKLQSMIDNYCEHEWENICCQCELDKIYCHKCERTINDNK